ncbi:MAG: thioesterase family protein [Pedobacter sp.]|jgi:acyl-CoA thioester hydrolase
MEGFHYETPIPIRFADIDALGHVNNAIYLTYFEIARSAYWEEIIEWDWNSFGIILRRSVVEYLKPIKLEDKINAYVRTSRLGNSSFDLDYILVKSVNGIEEICTTGQTLCISFDYALNKSVPIPDIQRKKMEASMANDLEAK